MIEDDNLYVDCKVYLRDKVICKSIDLNWYPSLKEDLSDIFN